MATTTTINPTSDSFLQENQADTAKGTQTVLRVGQFGSTYRRHGVFQFDVSAFTSPTDIVEANFTLTESTTFGSSTRTMKLTRLNQAYTEDEVTWNSAATGTVWTGGAGAEDNGEYTQPTYSITVGNSIGNQTVDIKELVIDAINKRSGVLRMVLAFALDDTDTSTVGSSVFWSRTGTTPPTLAITVAERKVWVSTSSRSLDNSANWDPSGIPTEDDIAIFNTGNIDGTSGALSCWRCYIGKNYKGTLGSSDTLIELPLSSEVHFSSASSGQFLDINPRAATSAHVYITDTTSSAGEFILDGKYEPTIRRTRHEIELRTEDVTTVEAHSRSASFSCDDDVTTARISGAFARLLDGAATVTITNGGRAVISRVDSDSNVNMAGNSMVRFYADEVDTIKIYSGTARFKGNEGAPIQVTGLWIYRGGLADTRTGNGTFTMSSAALMYGGRLLLDPTQNSAIA